MNRQKDSEYKKVCKQAKAYCNLRRPFPKKDSWSIARYIIWSYIDGYFYGKRAAEIELSKKELEQITNLIAQSSPV